MQEQELKASTRAGHLTPNRDAADLGIKDLIVDLVNNAKTFGGLDLSATDHTGIGDILLLLEGMRSFPQDKELLKKVILMTKLGVMMPTGKQKDEDKAFS